MEVNGNYTVGARRVLVPIRIITFVSCCSPKWRSWNGIRVQFWMSTGTTRAEGERVRWIGPGISNINKLYKASLSTGALPKCADTRDSQMHTRLSLLITTWANQHSKLQYPPYEKKYYNIYMEKFEKVIIILKCHTAPPYDKGLTQAGNNILVKYSYWFTPVWSEHTIHVVDFLNVEVKY